MEKMPSISNAVSLIQVKLCDIVREPRTIAQKEALKAQKLIVFEQKPLFSGHLEKFGEIWISIWINCQRLQPLL